jgi:uncharacterized DUF497 family protein
MVIFDEAKDAANIAKHGLSLARAADLAIDIIVEDDRHAEPRLLAFGLLDGRPYSLAFVMRGDDIRAISLRRAHWKEYRRYVR